MHMLELRHQQLQAVWHVEGDRPLSALARAQSAPAGPMILSSMHALPLTGSFSADSQGKAGFFALLMQLEGHQTLRGVSARGLVEPGDVVVWDSRHSCSFDVPDAAHKLQILIPADHLERLWPNLVPGHGWMKLPNRGSLAAMARSSLQALWSQRAQFDESDLHTGVEAVVDLFSQSVNPPRHTMRSKGELYQQALQFIEQALENAALDPSMIAQRHGCSVRALHAVFAEHGGTVAGTIRQRRLERCKACLFEEPTERISEVALRWGFGDAAHFSRLFRATYGTTPREFRDAARADRWPAGMPRPELSSTPCMDGALQ
jgi:AraC family transcriptional regulator, positive regulator of tynA and feaB